MRLTINEHGPEPIFQQIVDQLTRLTAAGQLAPGDALPSIRELAVRLRVNPNTVARSYRMLEDTGVIAMKRGIGAFVADPVPEDQLNRFRDNMIAEKIKDLVLTAHQLRVDVDNLLDQVKTAYEGGVA